MYIRILVTHIKVRTETGGIHEQDAEECIWKKEEVTDSRRNLHNEELRTLHSSPDIVILVE